jgi:hypothetical protein
VLDFCNTVVKTPSDGKEIGKMLNERKYITTRKLKKMHGIVGVGWAVAS